MKILITGASGFIGTAVLKEAVRRYGRENIIALTSSQIDENVKVVLHNGYKFDPNIFVDNGLIDIDALVHIGAFIPKYQAESNDILKCNSNIVNTEKILFSNLPNLKKVVFLSTIDVYPAADLISEETEERPVSLYGYSKLYCEKMILYFAEKHKQIYQILRIGHVYGPGEEKYKKIIPVAISKLLTNKEIEIFGDGQAIRTFIYLDDVVKSILNALDLPQSEGVINIVGESRITIENLVKMLIKIHADSNVVIKYNSSFTENINLIFDNQKLKEKLFNQFTLLNDGLRMEYLYMEEKIVRESVF
jgi:nucleoside-diphosphate-sugar epimerase